MIKDMKIGVPMRELRALHQGRFSATGKPAVRCREDRPVHGWWILPTLLVGLVIWVMVLGAALTLLLDMWWA